MAPHQQHSPFQVFSFKPPVPPLPAPIRRGLVRPWGQRDGGKKGRETIPMFASVEHQRPLPQCGGTGSHRGGVSCARPGVTVLDKHTNTHNTHTCIVARRHTRTNKYIQTHTHTRTHTQTHTHTQTNTHTHTHTLITHTVTHTHKLWCQSQTEGAIGVEGKDLGQ